MVRIIRREMPFEQQLVSRYLQACAGVLQPTFSIQQYLGQENNIAAETALEIQKEVLIPIQVTLWD